MNVLTRVVLKRPFKGFFVLLLKFIDLKVSLSCYKDAIAKEKSLRGQARCLHINLDYESIVCFFNYGFQKKKKEYYEAKVHNSGESI